MLEEFAQRLREAFEAYAATGDLQPATALLAPNVQWFAASEDVGPCRNRDEVVRVWRSWSERGDRVRLDDVVPSGDRVAMVSTGPGGERFATVATFRDGLIVKMQDFESPEAALASVHAGV